MVPPALDLPNPIVISGISLLCLGALASIARNCVTIYAGLRRQPPAELHFATKSELQAVILRNKELWDEARRDNESLEARHKESLNTLERRLTTNISETRSASEAHFAEMRAKVESLTNSVSALSGDLNRAIGRLEGASNALHAAAVKIASTPIITS